ncbi:ESPR domain-containing protein [Bibersteinia trehalosi]|uniref:ESPR domain-containing protein n=1 Tax=Bibersteinia trehalosi TaxID=47735 RepID=UPI00104E59A1|nr:ESPR domain-containing protein [Bibersteinia trehalosi]
MNNIHQVIFNRATQQFVVVSELAKSAGKSKVISADTVDVVSILQNFSEKRPLVDFSLPTRGQINNTANNTLRERWRITIFLNKTG